MTASINITVVALTTADTPSGTIVQGPDWLREKELAVPDKKAHFDPKVKAAEADFEMAFARLKATEDAVLIRTDPHAKELVEKFRKLLDQYKAQQKADAAKTGAKQ
jgi:hypothetical protein